MSESKYWGIIEDEETDAGGVTLDPNWDAGVDGLCDGLTCRHPECDCWTNFKLAVRKQLEKQKESMTEISACCGADLYKDCTGLSCGECGRHEERDLETKWIEKSS